MQALKNELIKPTFFPAASLRLLRLRTKIIALPLMQRDKYITTIAGIKICFASIVILFGPGLFISASFKNLI